MTEAETGIEMTVEDLGGTDENGSRNRVRSNSRDKSEVRRYHYCRELGHFMRECQNRKRNKARQKTQMQQIAEFAEGTMQKEAEDQLDVQETDQTMAEMCEDEGMDELHF